MLCCIFLVDNVSFAEDALHSSTVSCHVKSWTTSACSLLQYYIYHRLVVWPVSLYQSRSTSSISQPIRGQDSLSAHCQRRAWFLLVCMYHAIHQSDHKPCKTITWGGDILCISFPLFVCDLHTAIMKACLLLSLIFWNHFETKENAAPFDDMQRRGFRRRGCERMRWAGQGWDCSGYCCKDVHA